MKKIAAFQKGLAVQKISSPRCPPPIFVPVGRPKKNFTGGKFKAYKISMINKSFMHCKSSPGVEEKGA